MIASRFWNFVVTDFDDTLEERLKSLSVSRIVQYIVYSCLTSSSGSPFLMGYIVLKSPYKKKMFAIQSLLGVIASNCSLRPTGLSRTEIEYCKQGEFVEVGVSPFLGPNPKPSAVST